MAQIPDTQELINVERSLRHGSGVYAFASKLNSLVCWAFIDVGFLTQNMETPHLLSPVPTPVRRWYIPSTRTLSPGYPALPSPVHILLRGHTLVGDFRPRATPLPAVSDLLSRLGGWEAIRNQDWTFSTLSCPPVCDIVYRLVAFNGRLMSFGWQFFKDLHSSETKSARIFTFVLVLCAATFFASLVFFRRITIALALTPTCGYSLDSTHEVYGVEAVVCAARSSPTALAHADSRFDGIMPDPSTRDDLLGLITYVPCSTYSVLLFVNAIQIYKRPIVQQADNPREFLVPQAQTVKRPKTEHEKLEGQELSDETPVTVTGGRARKTRRGKRGGASLKEYQAKRLEWQKAWKRAVDTWGNGAWLEKGLDEEVEMTVD